MKKRFFAAGSAEQLNMPLLQQYLKVLFDSFKQFLKTILFSRY